MLRLLICLCCFCWAGEKFQFHGQASQDEFVYTILYNLLKKDGPGCYLEIGADEPISRNNTFFLETKLGWYGISIDISNWNESYWKSTRKNKLLIADAIVADYAAILQYFPKEIDYLSLDIDDHYDEVLRKIPLDQYRFKVITIEHDAWRFGDLYRKKEREILTSYGYYLLCPNVHNQGTPFEDWWVNPLMFSSELFSKLIAIDFSEKDPIAILKSLNSLKQDE